MPEPEGFLCSQEQDWYILTMAERTRAHIIVKGTVQGVGFRWFTRNAASACGIAGWVRNKADGSVEIEAEADRDAVEAFIEKVKQGPTFARVESASVDWITPTHSSTFEVTG